MVFSLTMIICAIFALCRAFESPLIISDEDYKLLPPIYEMTDIDQCNSMSHNYCKVDLKLNPLNESDKIWRLIETTKKSKFFYNHDEIYRTVCVPRRYNNSKDLNEFIIKFVNRKVQNANLTSTVQKITFSEPYYYTFTDCVIILILIGYLSLIIMTTLCDITGSQKNIILSKETIETFSLRSNYKNIFYRNKNVHYQNLKCIQGFRTITCMLIICTHTKLSFLFSFVDDTKTIEESSYQSPFAILFPSSCFLTQTFSLITAWLLTVEVLDVYKNHGQITGKDIFIIFINRIFRMWPPLIVSVICSRKAIVKALLNGALTDVLDTSAKNCEKYWFRSLLFIQNMFYGRDVCNEGYWFISVDVQLYFVCLIILYFMVRSKSPRILLTTCLLLSCGLYGTIIYVLNLDVLPRTFPENTKWSNFLNDRLMLYVYKMPHANLPTYILGICFGVYYYENNNTNNEYKKLNDKLWIISFLVLPVMAAKIAFGEFSRLFAALIGPLLKLMFAFGVGMGILGMSQNSGGFIKNVFEWRPLEFLSQFTYCTYITHFVFTLIRSVMNQPMRISESSFQIRAYAQDICFGFMIGFITHLVVELPWKRVQKTVLPQVKKKRED